MTTEITEDKFDSFVDGNKNVLIDCWAPWCGPCRRLGPVIDEIANENSQNLAVAKLNVDDAPGISARFQIQAIPTLLMFKDKVLVETLVGLRPKEDVLAVLREKGLLE